MHVKHLPCWFKVAGSKLTWTDWRSTVMERVMSAVPNDYTQSQKMPRALSKKRWSKHICWGEMSSALMSLPTMRTLLSETLTLERMRVPCRRISLGKSDGKHEEWRNWINQQMLAPFQALVWAEIKEKDLHARNMISKEAWRTCKLNQPDRRKQTYHLRCWGLTVGLQMIRQMFIDLSWTCKRKRVKITLRCSQARSEAKCEQITRVW